MCDREGCWRAADEGEGLGSLEDVSAALERYAATRGASGSPQRHREEMIACRRLIDRMELVFAGMAAELAGMGEMEWEAQRGPGEWIRRECRTWGPVASNAVAVGIETERLPHAAQALRRGEIGFAHLALLARTALELGTAVSRFDERPLLELARRHSVGRFREDCQHYRHAVDRQAVLDEQVEAVAARSLELRRHQNGCVGLSGFLDQEGGALLRTALEPLARSRGELDERGRDRRLADALVELCERSLDGGSLPRHAGQRPHLQLTCSLETLRDLPGSPAGHLEGGGPVPAETVRRLACDAQVTRVVFDARSEVMDVGRARRVPPTATRRALRARDRGCVWPGCERPAGSTHAHHLTHWAHGGATDLDNLVLICRYHHWKVHEGGWRLCRDEGRVTVLPPIPQRFGGPLARAPTG